MGDEVAVTVFSFASLFSSFVSPASVASIVGGVTACGQSLCFEFVIASETFAFIAKGTFAPVFVSFHVHMLQLLVARYLCFSGFVLPASTASVVLQGHTFDIVLLVFFTCLNTCSNIGVAISRISSKLYNNQSMFEGVVQLSS